MRVGWVRTHSGLMVNLLDPKPEMFTLPDIAHHLSLECRWGGATIRHYSVALHSLHVAAWMSKLSKDPKAIMHALLHDAHEAYLKDLPTPIKRLWPQYETLADNVQRALLLALGVPEPSPWMFPLIHLADQYSCYEESVRLTVGPPAGEKPPEDLPFFFMEPEAAASQFIRSFNDLAQA